MIWRLGTCLASAAVLLAACSSTPVSTSPAPEGAPAAPAPAAQPSDRPGPGAASPAQRRDVAARHLDPSDPLSLYHSIYFEFDDSAVRPSDAKTIELHAQYLRTNTSLHVVVEGNTDERGGREYNLALGQRRADSVRKALQLYGVRDAQVDAVSFGEEKPVGIGHDEDAWQKNRRADIVYRR